MREGIAWQKGARETESTLDTIHDRDAGPVMETECCFVRLTLAVSLMHHGGDTHLSPAEGTEERPAC